MRVLKKHIDLDLIISNLASFSDLFRTALYQKDETLFELLDYDNDVTFLEPSLVCYFLSDTEQTNKQPLPQCLLGYIPTEKRPTTISVKADKFGLVNLPNLGYLRTTPQKLLEITTEYINANLIPNIFVENSTIRLCLHPTDHLGLLETVNFDESIETSLEKHKNQLCQASLFFQKHLSEFWKLIELLTREFVVFSSPDYNSFAGIGQQGTAYFNIENKQKSKVFFIDDIAHQCGHVIFNMLTLDAEKYLRVPKDYPLAEFSDIKGEGRGAYGAFHGLFTYTTILYSLAKVLELDESTSEEKHEALGRLGFYLSKFSMDIGLMNNPKILTKAGMEFHQQFQEGYDFIFGQYFSKVKILNYQDQPYTFQYDIFKKHNPILA